MPVLVGEVESPLMLHVGLIPRNTDSHGDGDVLRARSNDSEAAAEDEQLAVGDLDSIGHQNDRSKGRGAKAQIWLIHSITLRRFCGV